MYCDNDNVLINKASRSVSKIDLNSYFSPDR